MRPITASGRRYNNSGGNAAILCLFEQSHNLRQASDAVSPCNDLLSCTHSLEVDDVNRMWNT
jgi:hypothetical protein